MNTVLKIIFRSTDTIEGLLPVTGRRPRPWATPPWQKPGDYYLSRSEERAYLTEQLASLPSRWCYLQHAKSGRAGTLIRTVDASLAIPGNCPDFIREGLERGTLSVPVAVLRRGLEAAERRFQELVGEQGNVEPVPDAGTVVNISSLKPSPARTRPMEMG